jgi:hypothetical protein
MEGNEKPQAPDPPDPDEGLKNLNIDCGNNLTVSLVDHLSKPILTV